jgi:hypothetical protein
VEQDDPSAGAFREGDSPLVGNHRPSRSLPDGEAWNVRRDFRKAGWWPLASGVGCALVALSLMGSCVLAPFLVPYFQLFLIPPVLGAMALGAIGGLCRSWWVTGLVWCALLSLHLWHDLATNPYGYSSLYSTCVLNNPPPGFMYFHAWIQLYQLTLIPLTLGVAVLTHGWVAEHRRLRAEAGVPAPPSAGEPPVPVDPQARSTGVKSWRSGP